MFVNNWIYWKVELLQPVNMKHNHQVCTDIAQKNYLL